MKKLLALVLALVMSMSLVTISNAAFKDADKIDYKEAVDVMNAIGVFVGDENGKFNAKENLTREQAAKIIAYLELGDKTADALVGSNIFTDVASTRWSAGFIGYCAQAGVVNGVGDSKFNPTGALTALQFGKMLLVELGYDAKAEKMEGIDWAINTSKLMAKAKLMDGIDGSVNQVITREQAAKMSLNALKAPTVIYDTKGSSVTVNGAEINFGASEAKYNTSDVAADQNISNKQLTNNGGYLVELGEKLYPKLKLEYGNYTEAYDAFLRPADTWSYKNQKIGTYAWTPDLTYTKSVSASELYMDLGISTVGNGKKADYVAVDGVRDATQEGYLIQKSNTTKKFGGNGVLTEVYKDDNSVYIVEINTYVGDVSAVSAGTKTQNAYVTIANRGNGTSGTYETTDFAVDDVVLYTYSYKLDGTSYEGIQSVSKAPEKITGNLSEVTLNKNATVGSTKYDFSNKIANVADTTMLKYDVDVVLDNYGYAIDIQPTNTNTAYAVVLKIAATAGDFNKTAKAELLFTDGTTQVVSLTNKTGTTQVFDKDSTKDDGHNYDTGNDNGDIIRALDIVKYQVNNAGKYTLDRVAAANSDNTTLAGQTTALTQTTGFASTAKAKTDGTINNTTTTNGSYAFKADGNSYTANGKTLFVVATESGTDTVYTVYEGIKNVPTLTTTAAGVDSVVYCESNGLAKIVYIDATANSSLSSSSVIFLKPSSTMTATDNSKLGTYYTYSEAIVDGEKVEDFKVAADSFGTDADANLAAACAGGMFGSVNYDKNNIATVGSAFKTTGFDAAGAYKVTNGTGAHKNGTVTLGSIAYTYTSDCDVWYLDVNGVLTKIAPTGITTDSNDEVYFNLNAGLEVTDIVVVEVANKAPSNDTTLTTLQIKSKDVADGSKITVMTSENTGTTTTLVKKSASQTVTAKWYPSANDRTNDTNSEVWDLAHVGVLPVDTYYVRFFVTAADGVTKDTIDVDVDVVASETLTFTISNARVVIDGKTVADGARLEKKVGDTVTMEVTFADGYTTTKTVEYGGTALPGYSGTYEFTVTTSITAVNVAAT